VDDEEDIRTMAKLCLEKGGFEIIDTSNGDDALHLAQNESPDIILLDVVMPGKSGLEVCKILKTQNSTKHIPVIMFTVLSRDYDKQLTKEVGADAHFVKPFTPDNLRKTIQQKLKESKKQMLSLKLGLEFDNIRSKNILFEFNPSISYNRLIRDFVLECLSHGMKPIVITRKSSAVYQILDDHKGVNVIESTQPIMFSPIVNQYPSHTLAVIYDSITDLIFSTCFQNAYKTIQNTLKQFSENGTTSLFLFNSSAHNLKEVNGIRMLYNNYICNDKNGLSVKKFSKTSQNVKHYVVS
jgi:DNA-binding response OmpR family regulator